MPVVRLFRLSPGSTIFMTDDASKSKRKRKPTEQDFEAAREVLSRVPDAPQEGTAEYDKMLRNHAEFRASIGADRFDLLMGRREPCSSAERLHVQAFRESWDDERFKTTLFELINRPVDDEMLETYFEHMSTELETYIVIVKSVLNALNSGFEEDRSEARRTIDKAVEKLRKKAPLFKQELETLSDFLARAMETRELVTLGVWKASSAHMLATFVMNFVADEWERAEELSYRESRDPLEIFNERCIRTDVLPIPRDLDSLLHIERVRARDLLAQVQGTEPPPKNLQSDISEDDGLRWLPMRSFPKTVKAKLRHALGQDEDLNKVRTRKARTIQYYCLNDMRLRWPDEITQDLMDNGLTSVELDVG